MIALLMGLVGAAQAEEGLCLGDEVRVVADYAWPAAVGQGYFPMALQVENLADRDLELELSFQSTNNNGIEVERSLSLPRGRTESFEQALPAFSQHGAAYSLNVRAEGESLCYMSPLGSYQGVSGDSWLIFRDAPQTPGEQQVLESGLGLADDHMAIASPQDLAQSWVAYTSVDVVMLALDGEPPSEAELDPLLQWVRMGGFLIIRGEGATALSQQNPELSRWVQPRHALRASVERGYVRGLDGYSLGLGVVVVQEEPFTGPDKLLDSARLVSDTVPLRRWVNPPNYGPPPAYPQIPGVGSIPGGAFALLLFGVGMLLGPVNRLILRKRRPAMRLLSTPLLAGLSSLGLVGYGIASTGLGAQSASYSVSLLDQEAARVSVLEARQIYLGTAIAGGLRPGADTWDFPLEMDWDSRFKVELDAEGRLVSGDLLSSRVATTSLHLGERSSRLGLAWDGQRVQNNLDAELTGLVLMDHQGRTWVLDGVLAPGQGAELTLVEDTERVLQRVWKSSMVRSSSVVAYPRLDQDMAPGSYVARLDSSPFLDAEGLRMQERAGEHHVVGVLEAP